MLPLGRNKVPGQIKQRRGQDSAHRPCVCHLCSKCIAIYYYVNLLTQDIWMSGGFNTALRVRHGWSRAMVARSLWSVQVLKVPVRAPDVRGALTQPPRYRHGRRKRLPRHDLLGEERWLFLSKEKGLDHFPPRAFIRFIRIGMQIKLINHCQSVRVKQYKIYRELWGLILSYSQLVRGT